MDDLKADLQRRVANGEISSTVGAKAFPPISSRKLANEDINSSWVRNYLQRFGWRRLRQNTKGVYLEMDHPQMVQARKNFFEKIESGVDMRLVLNIDQVWRAGYAGTKYVLRKHRKKLGKRQSKKTAERNQLMDVHQNVQLARKSITVVTSSWGDMTPGPLAIHIPQGLVKPSIVRDFNAKHRGVAFAAFSESSSHFMTSQTFNELLVGIYGDAFSKQRKKYQLDGTIRGMFLADAWTGFHATSGGEDLQRKSFTMQYNVEMPIKMPGGWSANGQPVDQLHHVFRRKMAQVDADYLGYKSDLRKRKSYENLEVLGNGQAKTQVDFSKILEGTLQAWEQMPATIFRCAWTVCGYIQPHEAENLQQLATAAARVLDQTGFDSLLGAQIDPLPPAPHTARWTWCVERGSSWHSMPAPISIAVQKRVAQFTRKRADTLAAWTANTW